MNTSNQNKLRGRKHNSIPFTDDMQSVLKAELGRTGAKERTILSLLPPQLSGVTRQTLSAWRNGARKTVSKLEWEGVLNVLKTLPDQNSAISKPKL